jgi:hypothetical protein
LTPLERKRHEEEGVCLKCHKKGHCVFQCQKRRARSRSTRPTSKNDGGMDALWTRWSNSLHILVVLKPC